MQVLIEAYANMVDMVAPLLRRPIRPIRRSITRTSPAARYRRVAADLAHLPMSDGLPEAPFLAARVSFSDVADALGITRPALYRLWASQYDFWIDLTRYITYEINYAQPDHDMPWNALPAGMRASPPRLAAREVDEVMSTRTNQVQNIAFDDIRVVIRAASLGYPAVEDLGEIRQHVEAKRLDVFGADLAASMAVIGRHADGQVLLEMAASLWCIAEGLSLLHRLGLERCNRRTTVDFGHGTHTWTLLALATRATYFGFGGPMAEGDEVPRRPRPMRSPCRSESGPICRSKRSTPRRICSSTPSAIPSPPQTGQTCSTTSRSPGSQRSRASADARSTTCGPHVRS